jgi:steroid delta-isomerase-like uncharacterized protein
MRTTLSTALLALVLASCGGGAEEVKPIQPPPAPTVASADTAPPATATAKPETLPPAKPTMAEMQKQALQAYADAIGARDAKKVASLYAEDAVLMIPGVPEMKGREAIQKFTQDWFDGFSSTKLGFSRVWTKGDVMAAEWVATGKHTGDFMGVKASNKDTGVQGLSIVWLNQDGAIKADHRYMDMGTTMAQIGASKEKARPVATLPANTEWITSTGKPEEDKNVEVAKQMYALIDKGDDKGLFSFATDDFVMDDFSVPAAMKKAEAQKFMQGIFKAFPDLKQSIANTWAIGDYVIVEGVMHGTHKGPLMNIPPTKKTVDLHFVDVIAYKDGKAKSVSSYSDTVEMMTQLGRMKPPAPKKEGPAATPAKKDEKPAAPAKK